MIHLLSFMMGPTILLWVTNTETSFVEKNKYEDTFVGKLYYFLVTSFMYLQLNYTWWVDLFVHKTKKYAHTIFKHAFINSTGPTD